MPTSSDAADAFALFGLEPTLEIDLDALERSYLKQTRDCHPDHHAAADPERMTSLLDRAARLNDAYRRLCDRWERAALALQARQPDVLAVTKTLDPGFLMEAMEWAESAADSDAADSAVRATHEARVEAFWRSVQEAFARGDVREAATRFHQSKYARKALADLGGPDAGL